MRKADERLLVITRNYPPQTGGLETYSYNLIRELRRHLPLKVIALGRGKPHLIWFLPYALAAGLLYARSGHTCRIHLCDGLLAPIGYIVKRLTGCRVSATVHGLDVTFRFSVYQRLIPRALASLDRIVGVSRSTQDECVRRGIPAERCRVIPNGVHPGEFVLGARRRDLIQEVETGLGRSFAGRRLLLTVGRLVKRKGVLWFVEEVVPRIGDDFVYIVVGVGPELGAIRDAVQRHGLQERVILAGRLPDRLRNCLLNIADAFIMPNITVPGDVEGFGIAAIEAGACGLPVVAAGIQGLRDAVIDGVTGHLVAERDAEGFLARIRTLDLDRRLIRERVEAFFSWEQIGLAYAEMLKTDG